MKKRGCLAGLFLLAALMIGMCFLLGLPAGVRAVGLLDRELEKDRLGGTITLRWGDDVINGEYYGCDLAGERYWCLSVQGIELYYHDETISFDNGRSFVLSGLLEELPLPDEDDWKWLMLAGFRRERTGDRESFVLRLDEPRIKLLCALMPEYETQIRTLEGAALRVDSSRGSFVELMVTAPGWELQLEPENAGLVVPPEVLLAMESENGSDARVLIPLLRACEDLAQAEAAGADMTLLVDCGPLPIRDSAQVWSTAQGLYFTRGSKTIDLTPEGLCGTGELYRGLAFALCRDGELTITGTGDSQISLDVKADDLNDMITTLLPELQGLDVELEDGIMTFTVLDHRLTAMELRCSGQMPFLVTTIPLELNVTLERMEGAVALPEGIG